MSSTYPRKKRPWMGVPNVTGVAWARLLLGSVGSTAAWNDVEIV